jgi:hypothetical protein
VEVQPLAFYHASHFSSCKILRSGLKVQPLSTTVYNINVEHHDVPLIIREFPSIEHYILCSENFWFESLSEGYYPV